jgi:hypothetical protein
VFLFGLNQLHFSKLHPLFIFSLSVVEFINQSFDLCDRLTEYKGKLAMTCIDRESNLVEVWIMEDHDRKRWSKSHSLNIGVLTRKEPHVSLLAFCNSDIMLIG